MPFAVPAWLRSPHLLLALTVMSWSLNWVAGRGMRDEIPPMALSFLRWIVALAVVLPFAWPKLRRQWPLIRQHWRPLLALGLFGSGLHNALSYLGLNYTTASNGVILNSVVPIMIISLAWIVLGERLSGRQWLGVLVSLGGVLAILSHGDWRQLAAFRLNAGDLIVLLALLFWSIYSVGLRWKPAGLDPFVFLVALIVVGLAALVPLVIIEMALGRHVVWSWPVVGTLAYIGIVPSILGFVLWNYGVEQVGPSVAGLYVHLMPLFGCLLSWLVLGEAILVYHWIGMALIIGGIFITSRAGRPVTQADSTQSME